jgi:hypothetical protein
MPTPECYRGLPGLPRLSNTETEIEAETPMPGGGGGGIGVFGGVLPRRVAFSTGLVAVAETTTVSHLSVDLSQNRLYQKRMLRRQRAHRQSSPDSEYGSTDEAAAPRLSPRALTR